MKVHINIYWLFNEFWRRVCAKSNLQIDIHLENDNNTMEIKADAGGETLEHTECPK